MTNQKMDKSQQHPFEIFLEEFVPKIAAKSKQANKALWILETTGSRDAADLHAELDTEFRLLFHKKKQYEQLLKWDQDPLLNDSLLKRQLNILIRSFKQNMISETLLSEISKQESELRFESSNFRATLHDKLVTEKLVTDNDIREILKNETNPKLRIQAWEASKQIGELQSSKIISLVKLRNQAAKNLGYQNFFEMQLDLQEVNEKWLFEFLDDLNAQSDTAYT